MVNKDTVDAPLEGVKELDILPIDVHSHAGVPAVCVLIVPDHAVFQIIGKTMQRQHAIRCMVEQGGLLVS